MFPQRCAEKIHSDDVVKGVCCWWLLIWGYYAQTVNLYTQTVNPVLWVVEVIEIHRILNSNRAKCALLKCNPNVAGNPTFDQGCPIWVEATTMRCVNWSIATTISLGQILCLRLVPIPRAEAETPAPGSRVREIGTGRFLSPMRRTMSTEGGEVDKEGMEALGGLKTTQW